MKLRSIQLLRGLAAMAVVAHHAFPGRATKGAAGVDLFFVISGFIMATCARNRRPMEFLADRAWRIYPLWLIAVLPWLLMSPSTPLEAVTSITLWPVFGNQFLSPALGVGWTLSFELVFYLCFALALATRPIIPVVLYGVCLLLSFNSGNVFFWFLGSPLAFEFLLGLGIAGLRPVQSTGAAVLIGGIILFLMAPAAYYDTAFGQPAIFRVLAWGVPAAMVLYGVRSLESWFAQPIFQLAVLLGSASYSIYLFHQLLLLEMPGLLGLLIAPLAGIVIYLLVERRIMNSRPRWSGMKGRPRDLTATQKGAKALL